MAVKNHITQSELKLALSYDRETGVFTRICIPGTRVDLVNKKTNCLDSSTGYIRIRVDNRLYYAHRLAWLYEFGEVPSLYVDHINGVKSDNRIQNLRLADNSQNMHNRMATKASKTGYKGVFITPSTGKYIAKIKINGKPKSLGTYETAELAFDAYKKAADEFFPEFCRVTA